MRPAIGFALIAILLLPASFSGAAAPTRDAYIDEVDPICKRADRKVRRAFEGFPEALDNHRHKRAARILLETVRVYARSVGDLERVEPPEQDGERIGKWLRLEQRDIAVTKRMAKALRRERIARYNRGVDKSRALERRINGTIGDYGFKHCN